MGIHCIPNRFGIHTHIFHLGAVSIGNMCDPDTLGLCPPLAKKANLDTASKLKGVDVTIRCFHAKQAVGPMLDRRLALLLK